MYYYYYYYKVVLFFCEGLGYGNVDGGQSDSNHWPIGPVELKTSGPTALKYATGTLGHCQCRALVSVLTSPPGWHTCGPQQEASTCAQGGHRIPVSAHTPPAKQTNIHVQPTVQEHRANQNTHSPWETNRHTCTGTQSKLKYTLPLGNKPTYMSRSTEQTKVHIPPGKQTNIHVQEHRAN